MVELSEREEGLLRDLREADKTFETWTTEVRKALGVDHPEVPDLKSTLEAIGELKKNRRVGVIARAAEILRSRGIYAEAHPLGHAISIKSPSDPSFVIDAERAAMTPEQLADELQRHETENARRWNEDRARL